MKIWIDTLTTSRELVKLTANIWPLESTKVTRFFTSLEERVNLDNLKNLNTIL